MSKKYKKFRTLSDVYQTGEDYQDDVSTPYRLSEAWEVVMTDKSGQHEPEILQVDDDDIREIKNLAKMSEQGGRMLAEKWCKSANFGYEKYINNVIVLMQKFDFGDWSGLKEFITKKNNPNIKLSDIFTEEMGDAPLLTSGLMDVCKDLLQYDHREEEAARLFFHELMKLSYKVAGTSVGDGEFLLAMLTDGIKGDSTTGGDVAVPLIGQEGQYNRYEIGTQTKIIYGGESKARSGLDLNFNRKDWTVMRETFITQQDEKVKQQLVKDYVKMVFDNKFLSPYLDILSNQIYTALTRNPNDDLKNQSDCQKILGAAVLYYYINHHGDDIIVIINMPHQLKAPKAEYFARYLRVKDNFNGTLQAINNGHFVINIDTGGVFRISIPSSGIPNLTP